MEPEDELTTEAVAEAMSVDDGWAASNRREAALRWAVEVEGRRVGLFAKDEGGDYAAAIVETARKFEAFLAGGQSA